MLTIAKKNHYVAVCLHSIPHQGDATGLNDLKHFP